MKDVFRNTLAALAGALVGMLLIGISDFIGTRLAPPAVGIDRQNQAAVAAYVASVPVHVFLAVLSGYFIAVLTGAFLAGRFSSEGGTRQAVMVTLLFLVASALRARGSPYPTWFIAANFALVALGGWLAVIMLARRRSSAPGA